MAVNLNDIAKKLNISAATVSRALNDRPGVGAEMRKRIMETATELGFVPNMAARSLATSRTQTVGFVVRPFDRPFTSDPFYFPMLMSIEEELVIHDYHILLNSVTEDNNTSLRMMDQSRVDGVILVGPNLDTQFVNLMCSSGFPVVLIDNKPTQIKTNVVLSDDTNGAYEATRHLIDHGHTNIAHIGGPLHWVSSQQRYNGYLAAMKEAGLSDIQAIHAESTSVATGEKAAAELLSRPERPTAVFAANDAMAVGAARTAMERGLTIPGDLALIGFDNIPITEHFSPPITTVQIFKEQIGRLAARRILELMNDPASVPVESIVSTKLVIRQSCGCA